MLHSLPPRGSMQSKETSFDEIRDITSLLQSMRAESGLTEFPFLPITAQTSPDVEPPSLFQNFIQTAEGKGTRYFWGRVPLDRLIMHFSESFAVPADKEYIDLGAPLIQAGSGSSYDQDCAELLSRNTLQGAEMARAAIIDMGDTSYSYPDNYSGRLEHAVTSLGLSAHAERVLFVLLDRLDQQNTLSDTRVSCSLVIPPSSNIAIGFDCFKQATAAEMLGALQALETHLAYDALPTVINMSLGTHVGPHNGQSPLEKFIADKIVHPHKRFLFAAAGNEGTKGIAARCELEANQRDFVTITTGPRCKELLLELWWDAPHGATLSLEAKIFEILPSGGNAHRATIGINPNRVGAFLNAYPAGLASHMASYSLIATACCGTMQCAALALTSVGAGLGMSWIPPLPPLFVQIEMQDSADTIVHGWIVVCEQNPQTVFGCGRSDGTIMVPACSEEVIGVAGTEPTGQMWIGSSRGPAPNYTPGKLSYRSPSMSHLASLAGERGTSYASGSRHSI
jgi:hypothetical protein